MVEQVLAVIPARGGSKGIPGKNIRMVGGKPLIAYAIEAARTAQRVSRVVVSTDDREIAAVARHYGAEVIDRPAYLSGDLAKSEDALVHALDELAVEGYAPDLILLVQCTSPLTTSEDLDGTVAALIDGQADTAVAVAAFHYFLWSRSDMGEGEPVNHDKSVRLMRQERRPEFIETGAVYAMRVPGFRETKHRFFGKTVLHETPAENRLEIDEPEDLVLAEQILALRAARKDMAEGSGQLKAIVFDFDGVMTDDRVFVDQDGRESVVCSRRDGMGVEILRGLGIPMVVISKEKNAVVAARCRKLKLEVYHGIDNKLELLKSWLNEQAIEPGDCLYVGNDINDLECMRYAGISAAPRDAHPAALDAAGLVLDADGGRGAVRALSDAVIAGSLPFALPARTSFT